MEKTCFHNGVLYVNEQRGPLLTWRKAENQPICGAPHTGCAADAMMPLHIWHRALAFMDWGQQTHKAEVLVIFFFHRETKEWDVWACPQVLKGMAVSGVENEEYRAQRKQWGAGWIQMGSLHHHCTDSAFASGTDTKDEEKRDGFHVTVGNMDKPWPARSWHVRATVKGESLPSKLEYFIRAPESVLAEVPPSVRAAVAASFLQEPLPGTFFPEEWKTNCKRKEGKEGRRDIHLGDMLPLSMDEDIVEMESIFFSGTKGTGRLVDTNMGEAIISMERFGDVLIYRKMHGTGGMDRLCNLIYAGMRAGVIDHTSEKNMETFLSDTPLFALLPHSALDDYGWMEEVRTKHGAARGIFLTGIDRIIRAAECKAGPTDELLSIAGVSFDRYEGKGSTKKAAPADIRDEILTMIEDAITIHL